MSTKRFSAALLAGAVALLLSACATSTQTTEDLPRPKSGAWKVMSTNQNGKTETYIDCLNRDTFYKARQLQQAHRDVQQCNTKTNPNSAGWKFSTNCKVGQTEQRIQTDREISGDFQSSFHILSVTKQQMPDGSVVEGTRNIKGEYQGACSAGQNPGDRLFSDGNKVNFYDLTGIAPN